jgi:glutamate dehydrogenase (NAD(P)+)
MVFEEIARREGWDPKQMTAAVQGFGNVGSYACRFLSEIGVKVVAISDVSGAYHAEKGVDISRAWSHNTRHGSLEGFAEGDRISNEELLALKVDVLVPAALGGVLHRDNASRVKARIVLEAANAPVTDAGEKVLEGNGVYLIPDVLANSGGVTVSYFEWVQNIQQFTWDEDRVNAELGKVLGRATTQVWELAKQRSVSMRTAAFMIAIDRVAEAERLRGV